VTDLWIADKASPAGRPTKEGSTMPPAYADDVDGGAAARRRLPDFSRRRLTIDDASYHVPAAAAAGRPAQIQEVIQRKKAAPSRSTLPRRRIKILRPSGRFVRFISRGEDPAACRSLFFSQWSSE